MRTILIGIYFITTILQAGTIKATVNQTDIIRGGAVQLTLNATGNNIEFPTITAIGDYPIESTSTMSQSSIKVINGETKQEISKKKIVSFTPDKNMTIPQFEVTVDGEKLKSSEIKITVSSPSSYTPKGNEKFTLRVDSSKKEVFVGEPLLVSIYFSEQKGVDLMDFRSQHPNFKNAISKEIKGEQTYQQGNYIVHKFNYIVTPTRDENLTIEPLVAKVAERSQVRDNFFGTLFDKPKWSQVVSNSLTIKVKPTPNSSDLSGDFKLSQKIDAKDVKANKPVNLTINISGEGNLEDFDELNYEIDGVTIYSDDAIVSHKLNGGKLISNYTKKFVFISDHDFEIPAKSFSVFNFRTNKDYTLNIDKYSIKVKGEALKATVVTPTATTSGGAKEIASATTDITLNNHSHSNNIYLSILSFLLGVVVTTIIFKFDEIKSFRFNSSPYRESEALKILYPHINSNRDVESMVRDLYAKKGGDKSIKIDKKELKEMIQRYI